MNIKPTSVQAVPVQVPAGQAQAGNRAPSPRPVATVSPAQNTQKSAADAQPQQGAASRELQNATEALQRRLSAVAPELQFSVDSDSGRSIIKVTDRATNEVIRQIPSEDALRISKAIDRLQGLLLDRKS